MSSEGVLRDLDEEFVEGQERGDWAYCAEVARYAVRRLSGDGHAAHRAHFNVLLAMSLERLPTGDPAEHREAAIAAVRDALREYAHLPPSTKRAVAKVQLGRLYLARERGNRAENLEIAIAALDEGATELPRSSDMWAGVQTTLGFAYLERAGGDQAENMERALAAAGRALEVLSPTADPEEWGRAEHLRAIALFQRRRGVPAENLEQALDAARNFVRAAPRDRDAREWAIAMATLGQVLRARVRGGRAENQEEAIAAFTQASEELTRDASPWEFAPLMQGLGAALAERLRGERRDNLERALVALSQAAEVLSPADDPSGWGQAMNSLAIVHAQWMGEDRAAHVEQALAAFRRVREVLSRETDPELWARATRNLGTLYLEGRIGGGADEAEHVEQALAAFGEALEVYTRETAPVEWAETVHDIGIAYQARQRGDRAENARRAVAAHLQALEVFTFEALPGRHASAQRALGDLHFAARRWAAAYEAYAAAVRATGFLYRASAAPDARQLELREGGRAPARAAYALAKLGRPAEAVVVAEQQAAQGLSEVLARQEAALREATAEDREAFGRARERVAELEARARREGQLGAGGGSITAVLSELQRARAALQTVAERIRAYLPQFMPEQMTFEAISGVAQELGWPLVYLMTTPQGSVGLVVLPGAGSVAADDVVWLDRFTTDVLNTIMYDRPAGGRGYLSQVVGTGGESGTPALMETLNLAWPILDTVLMSPVARRLVAAGHTHAVLLAAGVLSLLPLPAVATGVGLASAPSARSLQTALRARRDRSGHAPLVAGVGNPLPSPRPLRFASLELRAVESYFPAPARRTLHEEEATLTRLRAALPGATHVHFACHGRFDPAQALRSELMLAGGDRLTLLELLEGAVDLSSARLAVLSACQTGLTDFRTVPEEAVGFPAGLLQAGVPGVISARWPVDDLATALLMGRFYHLHLRGDPGTAEGPLPPALALERAASWLRSATARDLALAERWRQVYLASRQPADYQRMIHYRDHPLERPYAHPYFWAAFAYWGA